MLLGVEDPKLPSKTWKEKKAGGQFRALKTWHPAPILFDMGGG